MRIIVTFRGKQPIDLPLAYSQTVQGFIYNSISDEALKDFMHNKGFYNNKRVFKFFSFSRLEGDYILNKQRKRITFISDVTLKITSLFSPFIEDLASTLMKKDKIILGKNEIAILSISMEEPKVKEQMIVRTISPIVLYSTLQNEYKKYTYYYHPGEKEFPKLIRDNLLRKYNTFHSGSHDLEFEIKPLEYEKNRLVITTYKNTIIKGWNGKFEIEGDKKLVNIAYNYGLGSKNSQGFGMIEEEEHFICRRPLIV